MNGSFDLVEAKDRGAECGIDGGGTRAWTHAPRPLSPRFCAAQSFKNLSPRRMSNQRILGSAIVALLILAAPLDAADSIETSAEAKQRRERVAERPAVRETLQAEGIS